MTADKGLQAGPGRPARWRQSCSRGKAPGWPDPCSGPGPYWQARGPANRRLLTIGPPGFLGGWAPVPSAAQLEVYLTKTTRTRQCFDESCPGPYRTVTADCIMARLPGGPVRWPRRGRRPGPVQQRGPASQTEDSEFSSDLLNEVRSED